MKAGMQNRHARAADFFGQAAEAGAATLGGENAVIARLRSQQAMSLSNQADAESLRGPAGAAESDLLNRRAWVVLVSLSLPVLQRRLDKGTLLPGRCNSVEEAFFVYEQQAMRRVMGQPPPDEDSLHVLASVAGYETTMQTAWLALNLLPCQLGTADQRARAQAFVLAAVRLIPPTAGVAHRMPSEDALVDLIERLMTPARYGADFCASVLALWRSPAVADALRSRGSLQGFAAARAAAGAEFAARQRADLAKYGLQRCALPSCGRREATALQFRVCGACKATRYCGPEHQAAHVEAHRAQCRGRG